MVEWSSIFFSQYVIKMQLSFPQNPGKISQLLALSFASRPIFPKLNRFHHNTHGGGGGGEGADSTHPP